MQKAPACTVETLSRAVRALLAPEAPVQVIGMRHGEKRYETLLTEEESLHAVDLGGFYRIPADNRDLNYDLSSAAGLAPGQGRAYHSDNARQLTEEEVKARLLAVPQLRALLTPDGAAFGR